MYVGLWPMVYTNCTPTVHQLYTNCTPTVHQLYTNCTPTVHQLYTNCTPTVILLKVDKLGINFLIHTKVGNGTVLFLRFDDSCATFRSDNRVAFILQRPISFMNVCNN